LKFPSASTLPSAIILPSASLMITSALGSPLPLTLAPSSETTKSVGSSGAVESTSGSTLLSESLSDELPPLPDPANAAIAAPPNNAINQYGGTSFDAAAPANPCAIGESAAISTNSCPSLSHQIAEESSSTINSLCSPSSFSLKKP